MESATTDFTALLNAAIDAADDAFRVAVAAQVRGTDDPAAWLRFRNVLGRALAISQLIGMAAEWGKAKALGALSPDQPAEVFEKVHIDALESGADETRDIFEPGEFWEAIEAFKTRVPRLAAQLPSVLNRAGTLAHGIAAAEQAEAVSDLARHSKAIAAALNPSFYVTGVSMDTTINLRELVAQAIEGQSDASSLGLPDFIDQAQLQGAANLTRARLETVYRNNVSAAYVDGRATILKAPEVKAVLPLAMIVEIHDSRTRGNPAGKYPKGYHWQMHGYINTIEAIDRQGIRPPNGHQCRGTLRGVTNWEAKKLGIVDDAGVLIPERLAAYNGVRQQIIDRGLYPDPGWRSAAA